MNKFVRNCTCNESCEFLVVKYIYNTIFIRIEAPNFEKNQYVISATNNSNNDSVRKENLECLMCLTLWLIIQDIFCHPKVFTQDIDSI